MSRKKKLWQFIGLDTSSNDSWHLLGAIALAFGLIYALQMCYGFSAALFPMLPAVAAYSAYVVDKEFLCYFPLSKHETYGRKELMIKGALVAALASLPFILAFLAFSYIF